MPYEIALDTEKRAIRALLRRAKKNGFYLEQIASEEGDEGQPETEQGKIDLATAFEISWLRFRGISDRQRFTVLYVMGNGNECLSDCSAPNAEQLALAESIIWPDLYPAD